MNEGSMSADTRDRTLEQRVAALEAIISRAVAAAELHPLGRRVLRLLGLAE